MLKNLVHDQVKILLERMDTHPEEFIKEGKWDEFLPPEVVQSPIITPRFKHFTKLEQYLIRKKYKSIVSAVLRQRAYDGILETLVFKEEKPETVIYSAPPHLGIWSNSAVSTLASNTLSIGNETLDAETIKHMKEHIKALRKEQMRMVKMGGK